jgi:hypothetical protein
MQTIGQASPEGAERRIERRVRALKGGRIVFNGDKSVFDCRIRNLSTGGALLEVPSMLGIPAHFDLIMDAAVNRRPCSVRWHTDRLIGVRFDDAPEKAAA